MAQYITSRRLELRIFSKIFWAVLFWDRRFLEMPHVRFCGGSYFGTGGASYKKRNKIKYLQGFPILGMRIPILGMRFLNEIKGLQGCPILGMRFLNEIKELQRSHFENPRTGQAGVVSFSECYTSQNEIRVLGHVSKRDSQNDTRLKMGFADRYT